MFGTKLKGIKAVVARASLIIGLLLLSASAIAAGPDLIKHIKLVSFADYPYVFERDETEKGLAVRYVDALMKRAGIDYDLRLLPPKRALLYTSTNNGSCVFPVERSQEREVLFSWVSPILVSRHGLFAFPRGKPGDISVLKDAQDLTIGSYLGSGIGDYLRSLEFQVDFASDNDANIHKLKADRIDLWASDTLSAAFIADQANVELGEAEFVFFSSLKAMACNLGVSDHSIKHLNRLLREMYQDGSFKRIRMAFEQDFLNM